MIGQVLCLEAEAQGVRATGIGCFFGDPVHELMGLTETRGWRRAQPRTTWKRRSVNPQSMQRRRLLQIARFQGR